MNETSIRRRWFRPRYSLATLFVGVTVFGVWLGVQVKWIKDRRAFLKDPRVQRYYQSDITIPRAPGFLWAFGENGVPVIAINGPNEELAREVQLLFPESYLSNIQFGKE